MLLWESTGKYFVEVASELGVDEVVDHGIDQGGGHGQQVDTQVYILYPGKVANIWNEKNIIYQFYILSYSFDYKQLKKHGSRVDNCMI